VRGGLSMAMMAQKMGKKGILLPVESSDEAGLLKDFDVLPIRSLTEAVAFFRGETKIIPVQTSKPQLDKSLELFDEIDFADVKGQSNVKRAVEVAVAGGHNLLIIGPPGSGKSMIAKRIPSILPDPSHEEFLEILNIHSAAGNFVLKDENSFKRPVRSPHHTISDVGLLGGGTIPGPGEISLAHNGILFLDELPEFKRSALEVMRQPLEDGEVTISRSAGKVTLPSRFMLVAAMNPCPCGYLGDSMNDCRCSMPQIQKYRSKVSGPLLDRIDIHVEAPAVRVEDIQSKKAEETSSVIRERVRLCKLIQTERYKLNKITSNANMSNKLLKKHCSIGDKEASILNRAMNELSLSARAYDKILKVSRTIADLDGSMVIQMNHLLEAIQYRSLDRSYIL